MDSTGDYLSAAAAAKEYGLNEYTIRRWWALKKLPRYKLGRLSRCRRSDIEKLIARCTALHEAQSAKVPEAFRRAEAAQ